MHKGNKGIKAALFVMLVLYIWPAVAQRPIGDDICKAFDGSMQAKCHYRRSVFLLHDTYDANDRQFLPDLDTINSMAKRERLLLGMAELKVVSDDPTGINLPRYGVELEQASARLSLAYYYERNRDFSAFERERELARQQFLALFTQASSSEPDKLRLAPTIALRLLRCGASADALRVTSALNENDSARDYITAEIQFSLGDRKGASESYERWLKSGCEYEPMMLLSDEYGKKWGLLLRSQPSNQKRCEQLPTEIRTRLENLYEIYGHPNNLPKRSFPATIFSPIYG
jgi:hypothetical protein